MNTKHTPEPWEQRVKDLDERTHPAYREIKAGCGYYVDINQKEKGFGITGYISEQDASRIVACVNACAGMEDPAKEIASLRARIAELEWATIEPTTVFGWLQRLPDGYRERALSQCKMLSLNCDTMATSVHFMSKHRTVEGWGFWDDVYLHYKRGTPLPPLPI
jgi:hypothetical protein